MNIFNTDNWGFTHINMSKSSYLWSIKNYSCIAIKRGEKLESPLFSLDCDNSRQFCIAVWPSGTNDSKVGYIAMSFCNKSSHPVEIEFCISILDKKGNKFSESKKRNCIDAKSYDGFNEFLLQSSLNETNGVLMNDVVTFFCEYSIPTASLNSTAVSVYPSSNLKTKALDAFERQLDSEEFSDFTLIAPCGKKLFVHKFILAARSPVFSAMIKTNMKEKTKNEAHIEDLEYDVLKEMLRFMYATKVDNLDNLVYDLVAAAEKYQIDGLKELCGKYLFKNINPENMMEIVDVAQRYKLETLKDHIHKYVTCHSKSLFDNVGFASDENMKILIETFCKLKLKKN